MKRNLCYMPTIVVILSIVALGQSLPNRKLTPGAVRTTSRKDVCSGVSTRKYRHTTASMKRKVCTIYGYSAKQCPDGKKMELDHAVSLELGGADDITNLWPQKYEPRPGAHEKDLVENFLHHEVCAGRISLPEAQREIRTNWLAVYKRMTRSQKRSAVRSR